MQFVFLLCAAGAGIAAGLGVQTYLPAQPAVVTWIAGALVFLTGVLLQEGLLRRRNEARTLHRLALLHRLNTDTRDELTNVEAELRRLRALVEAGAKAAAAAEPPGSRAASTDTPDAPPAGDTPTARDPAALVAEAKVLRGLVHQLDVEPADDAEPTLSRTAAKSGPLVESVRSALRQNKMDLFLGPIVALPQRKRRYFQSAIHLHGHGDELLPPQRYAAAARAAGLGAAIDKMLLIRTVQLVRKLPLGDTRVAFFCNVALDSFTDERFLADFVGYLGSGEDVSSHIVFEIAATDRTKFGAGGARKLEDLVRGGYRLCLAGVDDLDLDVPRLVEQGVRFLRIDADNLMPATRSDVEANRVRRFKQALDRAGVELIVDNIASEQMLVELLDFNIDFGAGLLFGEPRQAGGDREPAMAETTGAM
jgi:cyclic-di-GMP phosphodiesterase TipF (flagellum assembly factor)